MLDKELSNKKLLLKPKVEVNFIFQQGTILAFKTRNFIVQF
jgi:hypothetical protein